MNMKKTIAAVAACAMAVSAMATTVSAVDENATAAKSIHYDLTLKKEINNCDFTFSLMSVTTAPTSFNVYVPTSMFKFNDQLAFTRELNITAGSRSFDFTANKKLPNYDGCLTVSMQKYDATNTAWEESSIADGADYVVYTVDLTKGNGVAIANLLDASGTDQGKTVTITLKNLEATKGQEAVNDALIKGTDVDGSGTALANIESLVDSTSGAVITAIGCTDGTNLFNGRATVSANEIKEPMKTIANTTSNTAEIFDILGKKGSKNKDSSYVNVSAVINDMIANYDDVVFTFNTATENVLTDDILDKHTWYANDTLRRYVDYYVTNIPTAESWMGDSQFKSFAQHLYNLYGDEDSGFLYSDSYTFNNLFNAALVANNGYTMNQSTVAPFEYSKTSVSFSWSDLTGGNGFVSAASYVNTLQLATSSDWYWDSMDVTGYELAAEDATTEAGDTDEGEDIDDSEDEDFDIDDEDVDDVEDIEDEDDTDDVDVDVDDEDEVEAPVVENPKAGNAPIALAVIPVALAAAAVVAKKRG